MSRGWIQFVGSMMSLVFPLTTIAGDAKPAMVVASGSAALNGVRIRSTSTALPGDRVETDSASSAILNATGSTVQVGPNSAIKFGGDSMDLDSGTAQVNTGTGLRVQAKDVSIRPKMAQGKFQVSNTDRGIAVAALVGDVVVTRGTQTAVLQEGNSAMVNQGQQPPEKKKRRRPAGAIWGPSDGLLFGIAAGAIGIGVGISYLQLKDSRQPISNQIP